MNYVGKLLSNFKGFYNEINSATLTGAIDVAVVQQQDGTFLSSPFHVRFGKMGVLRAREKVVDIEINGEPVDLHMKLGEAGEAFFVQEAEMSSELPAYLATSPLPNTLELMEQGLRDLKRQTEEEEEKEMQVKQQQEQQEKEQLEKLDTPTAAETQDGEETPKISCSPFEKATLGTQTEVASQDCFQPICHVMDPSQDGATSDMHREDSNLSATGDSLPKRESQQSLAYYSLHNSFDQPTPDDEEGKVVQLSVTAGGTDVGTQTDMTGTEVENKAKVTLAATSSIPTVTYSSCDTTEADATLLDPTAGASDQTGLKSSSSASTTSSSKPKQSQSLDSILHAAGGETTEKSSESLEKMKVKRKRRRKIPSQKVGSLRKTRNDSSSSATSSLLEVESAEGIPVPSGHQEIVDGAEDEMQFDIEMSPDEMEAEMMSMARTISMPILEDKRSLSEEWAHSHFATNFHPFSDGDITPVVSPIGSRPPSPKSDTEYETNKTEVSSQTHLTGDDFQTLDDVRWEWGELPQTTPKKLTEGQLNEANEKEDESKPSGGLFRFMRKTKKIRHQPEQGGIYLEDLNLDEMDPEVAALYLYNPKGGTNQRHSLVEEEDNESGRGASLPQSPCSLDRESHPIVRPLAQKPMMGIPDMSLSLCGGLKESEGDISYDRFMQFLVTYDDFCQNPNIISDHNLVIRFGVKYYNWQIAGPIILSLFAFQRPLSEHSIEMLIKQHMPKKERRRGWIWWRTADEPVISKKPLGQEALSPPSSAPSSLPNSPQKKEKKERRRRKKKPDESGSSGDESDTSERMEPSATEQLSIQIPEEDIESRPEKYKKSLKLTSEQLAKLNLREGPNEITYSVTTQFQGTTKCTSYIYLWKWDDRIIVSDIDGTITKSDVLGQVLPMIGKDWSQAGIANLYKLIHQNGYKFLYLSARAIGQSKITRDYLRSIRQGDVKLPDGPLLLSPSSLISAFHREVIERKPEEFKISCLRDIIALFPKTRNPLYAGYGNKINDVWAYRAVGIPISRIFTVNHRGEVKMEHTHTYSSSYTKLTDILDHMFPPLVDKQPNLGVDGITSLTGSPTGKVPSGNFPAAAEYSTFTYWRQPLPDIELDLEKLTTSSQAAPKPPAASEEEKR